LSLNYDETYFLQFVSKKSQLIDTYISFGNKRVTNIHSMKFLGLIVDTSLSWKYHIEELQSKSNKACYAIRSIKPFMSLEVPRLTYFSYVHSVLSYGIIFWRNSSQNESIFRIQRRIIRVIMGSGRRDSCHELFMHLNILLLHSQCIFSLLLFITKNRDLI
jgi:hypothetical protein